MVIFTIAALTDWYDGYAARKTGGITMWGQFLDPLADKILVSSGFICFSILGYIPVWMVMVVVIRDFLITAFRSYAIIKNQPITTSFVAKTKTFVQFGILYLIFIYHLFVWNKSGSIYEHHFFGIKYSFVFLVLMWIVIILTVISGFEYLIKNRDHFRYIRADIIRLFKSFQN